MESGFESLPPSQSKQPLSCAITRGAVFGDKPGTSSFGAMSVAANRSADRPKPPMMRRRTRGGGSRGGRERRRSAKVFWASGFSVRRQTFEVRRDGRPKSKSLLPDVRRRGGDPTSAKTGHHLRSPSPPLP